MCKSAKLIIHSKRKLNILCPLIIAQSFAFQTINISVLQKYYYIYNSKY